jgi:hypothetical protein
MLIQIRQAVDNNGKKIRLVPRQLVVAPGNIFQAEVLLKSVLRSGNANNDINPIKSIGLAGRRRCSSVASDFSYRMVGSD